MPITPKELKKLRAKQHRDQNTQNARHAVIQELAATYNLVAPSLADHTKLIEWVRDQHHRLSEVKATREQNMQGNNRRIEQINEEIRVYVKQALEHIAHERQELQREYKERLDKETAILNAETERIDEKHQYLVSSNQEILKEAETKLLEVQQELQQLRDTASNVASKLAFHKSRNDARRQQALEITRIRQKTKKDKRALLERIRSACQKEEQTIASIQTQIDMYPEHRRRINEDYYNWLADIAATKEQINELEAEIENDNLDNIFADSGLVIHPTTPDTDKANPDADWGTHTEINSSSASVRQENLNLLKAELTRLQTEDIRRNPDNRYYSLDQELQKLINESVARKRQLSRLQTELAQAGAICPDAISLDSTTHLTPQELAEEAKIDKEYQNLKTQRQQLASAISTLTEEVKYIEAQVTTAKRILGEESNGRGKQLQAQWERAHKRWEVMQGRIKEWLDKEETKISERTVVINENNAKLCEEKQALAQLNSALGGADELCELNNIRITAVLQHLDKLHKLL